MLILIFLILVGAGFTFLSMQNTQLVSLNFLNYSFSNLPINYVIIGSILLGVILAFFISFINSISTAMKIRGQQQQLKQEKKSVAELTKKVHQLELENVGLKIDTDSGNTDKFSL